MRLSSIFVFVTSALLASTFPIDDYSRGNNYLSKRRQPRTETRRDAYDTVIEDKILSNGKLSESIVTFGNEVRPPGASGPITFYPARPTEERPNTFSLYDIPLHGRRRLNARDYHIAGSDFGMTYIENPDHRWMAFYRGQLNTHYTVIIHDLSEDGTIIRHFHKDSEPVLLSVHAFNTITERWEKKSALNDLQSVEWQNPPQQQVGHH